MLHRILRIRSSTLQNVRLQTTAAQSLGKPILTEEVNGKGVLILNRPEALNAVNLEMVETINQSLTKWQETHSLVLIKGAGQKAFSSGGDVPSIASAKDMSFKKKFFTIDYKTNYLIATLKIPYIALIDGITMGGGVGISVLGKYQVATERTLLAMPETSIGFFPDVGSSHFLQRLPGKIGLYIALTGARLKGKDIHEVGLATHYCNHEKLPQVERALLDVESSDDVEKVLNELCTVDRTGEYALAKYLDTINKCFDAPTIEDILVNLEKDGSDMAKKTIRTLRAVSPTSLKITRQHFENSAKCTLAECLQMDYRMAYRVLNCSDFYEGIRAQLITKDKKPKWNPARIEDVTNEYVQSFFQPLPEEDELVL